MELTILIPCYNEEDTIKKCIETAKKAIIDNNINGEVLVIDNNSTDKSFKIAKKAGARVIKEKTQGYGAALIRGTKESKGKYIIMADADCSYDLYNIMPFLDRLREGYDLVMGNRFKGGIEKGAMSFSHKYIGNPILSFIGKKLFKTKIGDFHCGIRGYNKNRFLSLNLSSTGMEYASEMVAKAHLNNFKIDEVPTILHKDERVNTKAKIRTIRDGFRHLKLMFKVYRECKNEKK